MKSLETFSPQSSQTKETVFSPELLKRTQQRFRILLIGILSLSALACVSERKVKRSYQFVPNRPAEERSEEPITIQMKDGNLQDDEFLSLDRSLQEAYGDHYSPNAVSQCFRERREEYQDRQVRGRELEIRILRDRVALLDPSLDRPEIDQLEQRVARLKSEILLFHGPQNPGF